MTLFKRGLIFFLRNGIKMGGQRERERERVGGWGGDIEGRRQTEGKAEMGKKKKKKREEKSAGLK